MAYQVLARKWRPKKFADLVGQEHVVKALQNALDKGRLHHAYLLTGTRGVGKTTIARILAKSLNCENAVHGEPCGVCASCTQIDSGRFVDLLEIDAASNTGIDNIREVLENAQYAPTLGRYKVYIIDEVHMLSKSAFNAMLKTLEEPPEHVKFILATTDPHKVPVTVLSRCLQFVLRNMTSQQVAGHLAYVLEQENIPFEPAALQLLGRAAAGSMRDALSLLDQAIAMGSGKVAEQDVRHMIGAVDKRYLYELLQGIVNQDGEMLVAKAQEMAARAVGFDNALGELSLLLQRLALLKTVPTAVDSSDPEYATLLRFSQYLGDEQIQLYYQCAIHGKQDLSLAPDEYAGFVMTLLRMLAFAPVAAKHHALDGVIEGTQLGAGEGGAAKKPLTLPAEAQVPAETAAADTPAAQSIETLEHAPGHETDVPPWEDAAAQDERPSEKTENRTFSDGLAPTAAAGFSPEMESLPQTAAITAEPQTPQDDTFADSHAATQDSVTAQAHEADDMRDWPEELDSTEQDLSAAAEGWADVPVMPEEDEEWAAPMPQNLPEAVLSGLEDDAAEEAAEEEVFVPMPDFAAQNWPHIINRLAAKLGSAQMLARNSAWVEYDQAQQKLYLSLNGHASIVERKEYFDKIRSALADAYLLPDLTLQTRDWQDNQGWETPAMRRLRLQQEGRDLAQQSLEADAGFRHIMQALDCREWKSGSLDLLENLE